MRQFLVALGLLLITQALPAAALDCAKATQPVEKMLCSTAKLKKADDDMSAAYFKLLRETRDQEFHEALIRSQRRWLEARLLGPQRFGAAEGDKTDDREILLQWTRERLDFLTNGRPIRAMEDQRKIAAKDSGGRFAGYDAGCSFFPPPYGNWSYTCVSTLHRQHHERICSVVQSWASGHLTDIRLVSVVKDGEPKPVASCSIGYASTDTLCPDPALDDTDKARARWKMKPDVTAELGLLPGTGKIWKYDPDLTSLQYEQPWMNECLFTPVFPPPEPSRPSSTP